MKETIDLKEETILKIRLSSTQLTLVNVSLENLELKKQLLLNDKKSMEDNYKELIKEISVDNEINIDEYTLDLANNKLVKK